MTGLIYHEDYLEHDTGDHPENKKRLLAILRRIEEKSLKDNLTSIKPQKASLAQIQYIHSKDYIEGIEYACRKGIRSLDMDTLICPKSFEVALLSAGGVLRGIDSILDGKVRNGFALVRPPGHHALRDRAMGFCLFNNISIGACYLKREKGLKKVLIVDWDVHHGNGTQDAFYDDPSVLYFSIHQYPYYPGTGGEEERGMGKGLGYTINVPLPGGSDTSDYLKAMDEKLLPKAKEFKPDFILISAGFDAHQDDPLAGMRVSTQGFKLLTERIKTLADEECEGRILSVLEGGYNLKALADSVVSHLESLIQ